MIRRMGWAILALALSCSALAQKVTVDWDHNVHNFTSFHTYQWVKPARQSANPLMDQRIVEAVDAQLTAKGMRQVDSHPDVLVTYRTGVQRQQSATVMGTGPRRFGGMGTIVPNVSNAGTLVVDISDGTSRQLLWRGSAADTLSDKPEKNSQKIKKAVTNMFKKYPPTSK